MKKGNYREIKRWIIIILMLSCIDFFTIMSLEKREIEVKSVNHQVYQGYGSYMGEENSFDKITDVLINMLKKEQKKTKWIIERKNRQYEKIVSIKDTLGCIKGTCSMYSKENKSRNEQYIKLEFFGIEEIKNFENMFTKIGGIFRSSFMENFTGYFYTKYNFNGELEQKEQIRIVNWYLIKENAEKVLDMKIENMLNIYAYSPKRIDSVVINGKKINLNLAFSYNENKNETEFYVATPFLNSEF